ncbi:MAG: hypothetical protein AAF800_04210 [Planctomycetota bacterium]
MANFNRQPALPPGSDDLPADTPPTRRQDAPPPRPEPMAHFAVLGLDHRTGQNISTVIEARSENHAQDLALRMGITVHEFKPMHPLAGAAAVEMARRDPTDRFNQPAHLDPAPGIRAAPGTGSTASPETPPPGTFRPDQLVPTPETRWTPKSNPLGSLAVLTVLGLVAALLYVTVLRDGGARTILAAVIPAPVEVAPMYDVSEPFDADLTFLEATGPPAPDSLSQSDQPDRPAALRLEGTVPPNARQPRGAAVIAGTILTPGQSVAGYRLVQVRDAHVLLQKDGRLVALRIRP